MRNRQRRDHHGFIHALQGHLREILLDELRCLLLIAGQKTLVIARRWVEDRFIAEQHAQEFELGHVFSDDDEQHRERHGDEQSDAAPDPGPENRRHQDGDR